MRDLIDRQATIDALEEHLDYLQKLNKDDNPKAESEWYGVNWARNTIADLPSAQPEPSTDIQDVLRYLDDVLHPLISPNNWNVYSELHDMVSSLPSAQLEVLACGNGELDAQSEQRWIPCSEKLPSKGLRVLMQLDNIWQIVGWYDMEDAQWFELTSEEPLDPNYHVLAWMPLPDPYEEKGKKNETN